MLALRRAGNDRLERHQDHLITRNLDLFHLLRYPCHAPQATRDYIGCALASPIMRSISSLAVRQSTHTTLRRLHRLGQPEALPDVDRHAPLWRRATRSKPNASTSNQHCNCSFRWLTYSPV
jgi:hypothetical protein